MECQRCPISPVVHAFTTANLEKSLGRIKSQKIHSAVVMLQDAMKKICSDCAPLSKKIDTAANKLRSAWNENYKALFAAVKEVDETQLAHVKDLQAAFQAVCLICTRDSNDDNPSNHGQTFVSMNSGNCHSNSGKASTTATDDNVVLSRADWIGSHASVDYNPSQYGGDPRTNLINSEEGIKPESEQACSLLPSEIEDMLRKEFSNFAGLDIIDKMLLSCIISGMNIAEFAKMLWLPYSIVNPQDNTIRSITKQAAHARWQNVIKKFPNFAAIACGTIRRTKSRKAAAEWMMNPNADKPNDQFSNGKLTPKARKEAQRAATKSAKTLPSSAYTKPPARRGRPPKYSNLINTQKNHPSAATDSVRNSVSRVSQISKTTRSKHNPNGKKQLDLLGENWDSFDSSQDG